jgi:hypothetical protein
VAYRARMAQLPKPVEAPVEQGDIRLCEGGGVRYFVLCDSPVRAEHEYFHTGTGETKTEPSYEHVCITLLTNDVDIASDTTPILTSDQTGMGYKLVAMNLTGHCFAHQLSKLRYGKLDPEVYAVVRKFLYRDFSMAQFPHIKRGMPLAGPADPRWDEHVALLDELHLLIGEAGLAMFADLDGEDHPKACPCSVCKPV